MDVVVFICGHEVAGFDGGLISCLSLGEADKTPQGSIVLCMNMELEDSISSGTWRGLRWCRSANSLSLRSAQKAPPHNHSLGLHTCAGLHDSCIELLKISVLCRHLEIPQQGIAIIASLGDVRSQPCSPAGIHLLVMYLQQ